MKRISDEDGSDAGQRNIGRFFLAAIPLVLGLAAVVWFGLWVAGYSFQKQKEADRHELSQQERAAVYVGATIKPKGKLAVQIVPKTCLAIIRADIDTKKRDWPYDGSEYFLMLYAQNNCGHDLTYGEFHWDTVSPNGTLLKSGYSNNCPHPSPGEIAECSFEIDPDDRTDKFRVWGEDRP